LDPLPQGFFRRPAPAVARDLIGAMLLVDGVGGIVVETEAYEAQDPASHSFGGRSRRNASMFGPAGHAYVYRSHGLHWCLDLVCGTAPTGSAVLVRALQPVLGLEAMRQRRGLADPRRLCAGPGCLSQALGVTGRLDGRPLDQPPFLIQAGEPPPQVVSGTRIGVTRGGATPWRFGWAGSPFLSRRFPG
jgi:DNA-3-methyladenine glycosylase